MFHEHIYIHMNTYIYIYIDHYCYLVICNRNKLPQSVLIAGLVKSLDADNAAPRLLSWSSLSIGVMYPEGPNTQR